MPNSPSASQPPWLRGPIAGIPALLQPVAHALVDADEDTRKALAGLTAEPARLVWVVDPERRVARVYRQDGTDDVISADGALLGEDVLPGFSCTLATVL